MKRILVLIQVFYFFSLFPWFAIWGLSFMSFDAGVGLYNTLFVLIITLYPVAVIITSVLAWYLYKKGRRRLPIRLTLIPMIWIFSFSLFVLWF